MLIYLLGILFVLLDIYFYQNKPRIKPFWYFVGAFIIMAFQDGVGVDFPGYERSFYEINSKGENINRSGEYGWFWINYMFGILGPLGFRTMIVFLSYIEVSAMARATAKYLNDRRYWILAFALFYFTFNGMMFHMTGLRQALAMQMFVLSLIYVGDSKLVKSALCIFIASIVHTSAFIGFPILMMAYFFTRKEWVLRFLVNKYTALSLVAIFVILFVNKSLIVEAFKLLIMSQSMEGDVQIQIQVLQSEDYVLLYVIYQFILLCLAAITISKVDGFKRIILFTTCLACIFMMVFDPQSGTLFRVGLYYEIFNVFSIPIIVQHFHKNVNKFAALLLLVFFLGYGLKTSLPYIDGTITAGHYNEYRFILQP